MAVARRQTSTHAVVPARTFAATAASVFGGRKITGGRGLADARPLRSSAATARTCSLSDTLETMSELVWGGTRTHWYCPEDDRKASKGGAPICREAASCFICNSVATPFGALLSSSATWLPISDSQCHSQPCAGLIAAEILELTPKHDTAISRDAQARITRATAIECISAAVRAALWEPDAVFVAAASFARWSRSVEARTYCAKWDMGSRDTAT
jgi:hypothetical protein